MNLKDINSKKVSMVLALFITLAAAWVSYLNRDENIEKYTITDFSLSCSSAVKTHKSYLSLDPKRGVKLGSYQRVENCQNLVARTYTEATIIKRKGQDVMLGLDLDGKNIVDFSSSKESSIGGVILIGIMIFAVVFGYRVDQNRKARQG